MHDPDSAGPIHLHDLVVRVLNASALDGDDGRRRGSVEEGHGILADVAGPHVDDGAGGFAVDAVGSERADDHVLHRPSRVDEDDWLLELTTPRG